MQNFSHLVSVTFQGVVLVFGRPVLDAAGHPIPDPVLVRADAEPFQIEAALVTRSVRVRLNHARLLQMAALA